MPHAGVPGAGGGHRFCQSARNPGSGGDYRHTRSPPGDSLRQRAGTDQSSLSCLGAGVEDRVAPHPAGRANADAHVESFHGRLREECLRVDWFTDLFDARRKVANWKMQYNEQRPHSSLGYRTPAEFARVVIPRAMQKT